MESLTHNRILKNTIFLYIRSFVSLLIKIYTSRLVLQSLGVEDFGVYQVVGGLVAMFSFLNSTMTVAAQRFLSYEIGLGKEGDVQKVFSTLVYVYIILSILIFIFIETIGVLFLNTKLNLGSVPYGVAHVVLLFTALSLVLTVNSVPYNSMLISKEDMGAFAYIDIFAEVLRLVVALALTLFTQDRVVYYSGLLFLVTLITRVIYVWICRKKYPETKLLMTWDKTLIKKIASFSGWTTISSLANVLKHQGMSIILNMFLGPIVNAAVGIAEQLNNAVRTFSSNFQMAFMPLITKNYAEREYVQMNRYVLSGAKMSTILLVIFAAPISIEADYLLTIWLGTPPPNSSILVVLLLMETVIQSATCTGNTAIRATGRIRNYEITFNVISLISIPLIYLMMLKFPLYWLPYVVISFFSIILTFVKISFIKHLIPGFNDGQYIKEVLIKVFGACFLALLLPVYLRIHLEQGIWRLLITATLFEVIYCSITYLVVTNDEEKEIVKNVTHKVLTFNKNQDA